MAYHFVSRDRCPGCRADRLETLHQSAFAGPLIGEFIRSYYGIDPKNLGPAIYRLDRCLDCQMVFQKYVGDERLLSDLYTLWVQDMPDPELDARYREDINAVNLSRDAHEIFAAASFLAKPLSQLRTLDYGMGWALWARICSKLGCRSFGSDLSAPRMAFAAKHGVIPLSDESIAEQIFDFINTEQVFEHVPDPAGLLERLVECLAPGGVIKISVPSGERVQAIVDLLNDGSTGDHDAIDPVHPLEHVNTFRRKSIDVMAERVGLRVVRPNYYHRFAFLRRRGTLSLRKPVKAARELIRPWYQYRNPANIYVWLQTPPASV